MYLCARRTEVTEIARPEQEDLGKEDEERLPYKMALSIGQVVDTVYRDLEANRVLKMHEPKFIGYIYIFQYVLPILNRLSKTFQRGSVNLSHIGPAVEHAKQKLQTISSEVIPVKQLQEDFKPGGRLSEIDLAPTEPHFDARLFFPDYQHQQSFPGVSASVESILHF